MLRIKEILPYALYAKRESIGIRNIEIYMMRMAISCLAKKTNQTQKKNQNRQTNKQKNNQETDEGTLKTPQCKALNLVVIDSTYVRFRL